MTPVGDKRGRDHLVGRTGVRRWLVGGVVGLLMIASVGFLLGFDVGLSGAWIVGALAVAIGAGWLGAGVGPTVGILWAISLWWFAFPPLVGYLGGGWEGSARYTHPRMMGFAYESARAELVGGLEYGVKYGILFAVVAGLVGYLIGATSRRVVTRFGDR